MSSEIDILPEGWQKTALEHLIIRISNGVNVTQYEEKIGLPITRIETIWNGTIDLNRVKYIKEDSDELRLKYGLRHGDILFSHINSDSHLGKTAIFRSQVKCLIHGTNLLLIRPSAEISSEYLNYQIQFLRQKGEFVAVAQRAVNQSSINQRKLKAFEFLLPPLNEQHRIVAKIEELFSELDKGIESLKTARAQLNVYRQSVLKHAFEGKLTAQWREENKDKLETPEQLLARIKQEREVRYDQQLKGWKAAVKTWEGNGKSGKKPQRPKKLPKVTDVGHDVTTKLPPLPESWMWEKLGWMTCGVEYGTAAKSATTGRVPVLRMGNIQNAKFDWGNLVYTSDDNEIAQYLLHDGDVLFNRTNSPELVGKTAIYKGERPAVFAGYLIRVNHIGTVVDSQYLNLFLNSHVARQYGNNVKTDGVNQSNINGAKLSNYPFPYCSIKEQREIARILERILSFVDETEGSIDQELLKADALRQSILKKAFSGQLVPQDPNDEPASVLLDRIRAEREQVAKNNHSKKTKKRKTTA